MTNLEFCVARRKAETPAFVRVLKAIPEERQDYRPDPKARTAAEIAWLLATEIGDAHLFRTWRLATQAAG